MTRLRLLLFLLVFSTAAIAQNPIEGKVIDKDTGKPVPFASLAIVGTSQGTSANLLGQFSLILPDTFSVKITCVGYESATVTSVEELHLIKLKAAVNQLSAVVIYKKEISANKIVKRAFAEITKNYDTQSFLQKFFYRHYTRRDSVYENLIEASAEVWKNDGYTSVRNSSGEKEEMRVLQLRRSLDITGMVQGKKPLHLTNILESDIVAYQNQNTYSRPNVFGGVSDLKTNFTDYVFSFDGTTNYDGHEVFKIDYSHKKDSVLTTSGYKSLPQITGSLYITTDTYAFIKTEEVKQDEFNNIRTIAHYGKYGDKYYPHHFVREGQNFFLQKYTSFHLELISLEVRHGDNEQFTGKEPGREELLRVPYDSTFWNYTSILKATPLEEDIIHDLGDGLSLNEQFYLYKQYELNVTDGGHRGEEKFAWLKEDSRNKRILYLCFWDNNFKSYLIDLEYLKQLNLVYKKDITFVLISLEEDNAQWQQLVTNHNFFSDGIVNYRVGKNSELAKMFNVTSTPTFIVISKEGEVNLNAKQPKDPLLETELKHLIGQK